MKTQIESSSRCARLSIFRTGFLVFLLLCAQAVTGGTLSWSGGGANALWSNSANWGYAGTPANGDTLVFPASQPNLTNTNDLSGLVVNQIRFVGAGSGYVLRGNALTVTNSLISTNTSGSTTIWNNIALGSADLSVQVGSGVSLSLNGQISGTSGVVKTGAGTCSYMFAGGNNTYTGTTRVNAGILQLNVGGANAFSGPLIVGDGSGASAIVRNLQSDEIPTTAITVNFNGILDLNGYSDTIGTSLTLNSGSVNTGAGTLSLAANSTLTVANPLGNSFMYGNLNLGATGTWTIQGSDGLSLYASISGTANIVKNGFMNIYLGGTNTFTGSMTVNGSGSISISKGSALGATNGSLTLNGATYLVFLGNVSVTNKNLIANSSYPSGVLRVDPAGFSVSWQASSISLNSTATLYVETNSILNLGVPMTGAGGVTKIGPGTLVYSGSGANTYTGLTSVNEGELDLGKSGNSGAIAGYGAGLVIGDGTGIDTVRYLANNQLYSIVTPLTVNGSGYLHLDAFSDIVAPLSIYAGHIDTGAAGKLSLSGTVVESGTSQIDGVVGLYGDVTVTNSSPDLLVLEADTSGTHSITKAGLGKLTLSGSNSYSGLTIVQQGILNVDTPWALGSTSSGTIVSNQASLVLEAVGITNETLTLNGPGMDIFWGSLDVETMTSYWAGPISLNANSTIDAWNPNSQLHIIGPISGPGGIECFGAPAGISYVFLEGATANTYTGTTTVDGDTRLVLNKSGSIAVPGNLVVNGVAQLGQSQQIADTADVLVNDGGVFDLSTRWEGVNTLRGAGMVSFGTDGWIEVGGYNGTSQFDGPFAGVGYTLGGYTIRKLGSGTFTANGNCAFAYGIINISGGTMVINGSNPTTPVTVQSGATFSGTGTVANVLCYGVLSPGPGPGVLTTSNLTFSSTGSLAVSLNGPTPGVGYDQVKVLGTNTLASAALNLSAFFTKPVHMNDQYFIITNAGLALVTGAFGGLPQGSSIGSGGYKFTLDYYSGGAGDNVALVATGMPAAGLGAAVSGGNGNHAIDPNECTDLDVAVTNQTGTVMSGITAVLSTTTPGVVVNQPYSAYPNAAAHSTSTNITGFQIATLPSFVCGSDIALQLTVESSLGAFSMPFVLSTGEPAASATRVDMNTLASIPDVGLLDSPVTVSGFSAGKLQKVVVSLWITHALDSDLTNISLVNPDNITNLLSAANGGGGQNYGSGSADGNRTTFDDAAATVITAGTAPFVGTYRPQMPLENFEGTTANGTWRLRIADGYGGSLGTLRCWSLLLYGTACADGGGNCDSCLMVTSGSIDSSDPVQTDRVTRSGIVASCGAPKASPGVYGDGLNRHYDLYSFVNPSPGEACVTVSLTAPGDLEAIVYTNTFNPSNITVNYAADPGSSTAGASRSCSLSVPAGATFYVVVNEVTPNALPGAYALQLSGLPCPQPTVSVQTVAPNTVRVFWPTWAGGYQLEASSSLTGGAWVPRPEEPMIFGGKYNVTNTVSGTGRFYRLHKP